MSQEQWWDVEERFCEQDRKLGRKERRFALAKDRSKFKKTDQDQLKKNQVAAVEGTFRGRVLCIRPEGVVVATEQTQRICQLKGALKQELSRMKNLIAVGDWVCGEGSSILSIEKRSSVLSRADNLSRNKEQLIAVNIDQVLITCSVSSPALKPFLVDRYIIAACKGNMTPIIVVNKIDLLDSEEYALFLNTYRSLGFTVIGVSVKTQEGIEELKSVMQGRTSVFSGQSGVGKSSLINCILGTQLPVGAIVQKTDKGSHTTTHTQLLPLEGGGFCIDTPGIKSFGIWDVKEEELRSHFTEIAQWSLGCKYTDCYHLDEPSCAVKKALEEGHIFPLRFASYVALMHSTRQTHTLR